MKRKNVIWCDFQPEDMWNFNEGLDSATGMRWERIVAVNNNMSSCKENIKRYIGYFWFPLKQFFVRNRYENIIAWQQFYGLLFAFYCRLFKVKKKSNLYIMIFVYIPKKGVLGKIYKRFMSYIVTSDYIDKIFVFSSAEGQRYESELGVSKDKFEFLPFGDDIKKNSLNCEYDKDFIFSSGYSNRDFDFLADTLKDEPYVTRIYGWENYTKGNVIVKNEVVGDKLDSFLRKCRIVVVPLKENRESGQFTIIHAMEAGVPMIVTDTDCMRDYIEDGVNGYLVPNVKEKWIEKIRLLFEDDDLYAKMSECCKDIYRAKHTQFALGINVGNCIKESQNKERES